MEPINPSVWRRARRNTARKVSAVRIARGEYQGCPPGVVRGAARHPSIASSENQTVKLPRWRRLASYSRQFITFRVCFGMWWRRSWFNLNGKAGIRRSEEGQSSYGGPVRSAISRIHATTPHLTLHALWKFPAVATGKGLVPRAEAAGLAARSEADLPGLLGPRH